ncbi:amidohydrolase [Pseudooceanicola sp. CBS1P-1]|uniref:Amidohydrolase n=1 Tax=Pseudooceanicola albus TaxID=2692189 RepID=A0A6L7FZJ8_9RHOB|nr:MULTISPECIES: M20 aminoacylase family protein [Pseudooceanicola]MBT9382548.1 amidohydrolase [Pseudooceanicola endophyticus]MXN17089.1 amidohydrolase [Pseudooceanicola albus]
MPIKNRFAELHAEITGWRRDLHAHPEILYEVHRTAGLVAEKLREFGCDEVVEGLGRTGVVGVIRGRSTGSGKVMGLRADMDALPILEETGVDYASKTPGAMHACGHDGHTAMLLGAAKYLAETRNFDGTAVIIFQPAEEGGGGGREMCEDGLMERFGIQEVYGMHNWPGVPLGQFAIRPGAFFASTDQFEITVKGHGGHAAKPHLAADPVVATGQLVVALQSIASRNADPVAQVVVSVTSVESSSKAFNVIPGSVTLRGTIRTMSEESRAMAETRLKAIGETVPAAMGCEGLVRWLPGYPTMVNSEAETDFAAEVARRVSGDCAPAEMTMGGEDFAYMLQERPGAYILVGNGDSAEVHNPAYNFDDEAIPAGCSYWAELVEQGMPAA